ncbi:hypothetical protein, conserved [Eimeria praecox]|uniref:Coiled-coil domain-containing protein 86 n=1 Tax=Eimeria praecox TaxID=51316 RepID=U6H6Y8_9EIME|nr:hypothetical protein, conserved [Eimeria praecox]
MQHAEDHSVSTAPEPHGTIAASDIPLRPEGEAAPAAVAVACELQQQSPEEGPLAQPTEEKVSLPSHPVAESASSSAEAEENTAAERKHAAGGDLHTPQIEGEAASTTEANRELATAHSLEDAEASADQMEEEENPPSETQQTVPRLMGRQTWRPRGQRLSFGRLCKGQSAPGGCVGDSTAAKKRWEQQQQQKEKQREARDAEKQARAVKEKVRLQRRKQREAKRQRKKENEMKSAKVQVIKDTTKIRKWNKQARRQLVKMSPEMIRQLYGVQL